MEPTLQVQVQNILCDCHESGSTLRFLIPVASLTNQKVTFIGQGRLMKRPMDIYQTLFDQQNLSFIQKEDHIEIQGAFKRKPLLDSRQYIQSVYQRTFIHTSFTSKGKYDHDSRTV